MKAALSYAPGMRIGLYGGSFNPPHAAHLLMSKTALRALKLDRIWWLVSPGNPLKDNAALPALEERLALSRALIDDPRIIATGVEADLGTFYTADTLAALQRRYRLARFVWLMGADNLANFDRWRGWQQIAARMPFAVFDRPGFSNRSLRSRAAITLSRHRIEESDAPLLAGLAPPAWVFLHGPLSSLSSTQIRKSAASKAP